MNESEEDIQLNHSSKHPFVKKHVKSTLSFFHQRNMSSSKSKSNTKANNDDDDDEIEDFIDSQPSESKIISNRNTYMKSIRNISSTHLKNTSTVSYNENRSHTIMIDSKTSNIQSNLEKCSNSSDSLDKYWICSECTLQNDSIHSNCEACHANRPLKGKSAWICSYCTYENHSKLSLLCEVCNNSNDKITTKSSPIRTVKQPILSLSPSALLVTTTATTAVANTINKRPDMKNVAVDSSKIKKISKNNNENNSNNNADYMARLNSLKTCSHDDDDDDDDEDDNIIDDDDDNDDDKQNDDFIDEDISYYSDSDNRSDTDGDPSDAYQVAFHENLTSSSSSSTNSNVPSNIPSSSTRYLQPTYPHLSKYFRSVEDINSSRLSTINFADFIFSSSSMKSLDRNYDKRRQGRTKKLETKKRKLPSSSKMKKKKYWSRFESKKK